MGCCGCKGKSKRPRIPSVSNQNKLRFSINVQPEGPRHFHDDYVIFGKVSQSNFHQIHVACKLGKDQKRHSVSHSLGLPFEKRSSLSDFEPNRSVKIVDLRLKTKRICRMAQNEVEIWKELGQHNHSDHCVHLYDVKYELELCFLVMELCAMSLLYYLSRVRVDERVLGEAFAQMLLGIEFLHKANVVHRDIKPDNFMVGGENRNSIKLCDFALATHFSHNHKLTGECGTPLFMSPEMILGRGYDSKADIWSFGVIVYALLFGRFPYDVDAKDSSEVKQTIAHGTSDPSFRTFVPITASVLSFTMSLLHREPKQRPLATEALKMQFMRQIQAHDHEIHNYNLPSLKPMLNRVTQLRSFQNKDVHDKTEIDDLLTQQQMQCHGLRIPGVDDQSVVVQSLGSDVALASTKKLQKRNSLENLDEAAAATAKRGFAAKRGSDRATEKKRGSDRGTESGGFNKYSSHHSHQSHHSSRESHYESHHSADYLINDADAESAVSV